MSLPSWAQLAETTRSPDINRVPHCRQQQDWDCGVTCIQMVLKHRGLDCSLAAVKAVSRSKGLGDSIWSIDLCTILKSYGVPSVLCSTELGASEQYQTQAFYAEDFDADAIRVNALFQNAAELGLEIRHASLNLAELEEHITDGGLAIVLLDASVYRRGTRLGLDLYALFTSILCFAKGREDGTPDAAGADGGSAFAGHYVVLCGVDTVAQTVHLADPASRAPMDMLAASVFEEARHSFGTDDDVILIPAVAPVVAFRHQHK